MPPLLPSFVEIVETLAIDAEQFKEHLVALARHVDGVQRDGNSAKASVRYAYEALAHHLYGRSEECRREPPQTKARNQFEKYEESIGRTDQHLRSKLQQHRGSFAGVAGDAGHVGREVTETDLRRALQEMIEYAKLAPTVDMTDKVAETVSKYRNQIQRRLQELLGGAYELPRCVAFVPRRIDERRSADNTSEPLGLAAARARALELETGLQGRPLTRELVEKRQRSLLLGDPGIGKSVESLRVAYELTDPEKHSCCALLHCSRLDPTFTTWAQRFGGEEGVGLTFEVFAWLTQWKRYLVVDGFDEFSDEGERVRRAIDDLLKQLPDVHVVVTSRHTSEARSTFHTSWQTYELRPVEVDDALLYLRSRWGSESARFRRFRSTLEEMKRESSVDCVVELVRVPFLLNALAETVGEGDALGELGRLKVVSGFVHRLLAREHQKSVLKFGPTEYIAIRKQLAAHAYRELLNVGKTTAQNAELAQLDLIFHPDGRTFRHGECRDYLGAHHLLDLAGQHKLAEAWAALRDLTDERRFALHSWVVELVNADHLPGPENPPVQHRRALLKQLWEDDAVAVSFGLHNDMWLKELPLPERPWEPFETGLLRIMRGEQASEIPETHDIAEVRLASPGEQLLHRLRSRELPMLLRGVPSGRAVLRLEAAWASAADPWATLVAPLGRVGERWAEKQPDMLGVATKVAYQLEEASTIASKAEDVAAAVVQGQAPTELLVSLYRRLAEARVTVGFAPQTIRVVDRARGFVLRALSLRRLSGRQLHRLKVEEARLNRDGGPGRLRHLQWMLKEIYGGNILREKNWPRWRSLKKPSLLAEISDLVEAQDTKDALYFIQNLWNQIAKEGGLHLLAPITLLQAIRTRVFQVTDVPKAEWYSKWDEYWYPRLNPYEIVQLSGVGLTWGVVPVSLQQVRGWVQARDAVLLARISHRSGAVEASPEPPQYSVEQKQHWIVTASRKELIGLLVTNVIDRNDEGDTFVQAVRRLEAESAPQHWWSLVRIKRVVADDIPETMRELRNQVETDPVAYELLVSADLYQWPPSETVTQRVASCDCPFDTRAHMVERGSVSVGRCWEHEVGVLSAVKETWTRGEQLYGLNGEPIGQKGGLLGGQFTMEFRRKADRLEVWHPGIEGPIQANSDQSRGWLRNAATKYNWRDGEMFMGFLWVFPRNGRDWIAYSSHNSGFKKIGRLFCDCSKSDSA